MAFHFNHLFTTFRRFAVWSSDVQLPAPTNGIKHIEFLTHYIFQSVLRVVDTLAETCGCRETAPMTLLDYMPPKSDSQLDCNTKLRIGYSPSYEVLLDFQGHCPTHYPSPCHFITYQDEVPTYSPKD